MVHVVQFKYNKAFAYISGLGLLALLLIFLFRTLQIDDIESKNILMCSDLVLLIMLAYFMIKVCIPAVKGQIALELNDEGLIDFVRQRSVSWDNIKDIRQISFKNSSGIAIDLVDKGKFLQGKTTSQRLRCFLTNSCYNTPMTISLQYIEGNNKKILQIIKTRFDQMDRS